MSTEKTYQVILSPHISEKSTVLADKARQHVFRVMPSATKKTVQQSIEHIFKVEVDKVNLINVKGKRKGAGRNRGKRKDWKKAYVILKEGHDIQFSGTE